MSTTASAGRAERTSGAVPAAPRVPAPLARRARGFWRGPEADPRWARPALLALLAATAVLYLVGLSASGWANAFYSAAVQAGSQSWEAFLFGSSDAGGAITVDKPPASLWVMALSVRLFGLSSWSILVPQALMGVATVAVLHGAVKRVATPAAGLLAGAVLALTPVAALMFRFNNPDAMLVLVMTAAAAATLHAVRTGRARWIVATGALVGLGFLVKQLQVLLVLPALGSAYLLAAPHPLLRRLEHLLRAAAAMLLAAGWWVALVELVPESARPYVGGSQTNSILELTFGYNGLGRLTGEETGSVGGGAGWGTTGLTRMLDGQAGGQIAWLLPAALVLAAAGLALAGRAPRTDVLRASYVLWGGWLVVTALVFSFMSGIFHDYYTVALAPAVAALVGLGAADLWRVRGTTAWALPLLGTATAGTAVWAFELLGRSAEFVPPLRWAVLVAGLLAGSALAAGRVLGARVAAAAAVVAVVAALAGPASYTAQTVATAHTGSIVTAGPAVSGGQGGPGGMRGGFGGARGQFPGGATGQAPGGATGQAPGAAGGVGGGRGGAGGGMGGLLGASTPDAELVALLEADADSYTWVAAAIGSNNAAGLQLATEEPVMPVGGFNGTDPAPTLAQFQQYVADGEVHYFVGGAVMQGDSGSSASQEIAAWVAANFTAQTVGGTTVYDLSGGTAAAAGDA